MADTGSSDRGDRTFVLLVSIVAATGGFLFGYDLSNYAELFEEKLELFMRLQREKVALRANCCFLALSASWKRPRPQSQSAG